MTTCGKYLPPHRSGSLTLGVKSQYSILQLPKVNQRQHIRAGRRACDPRALGGWNVLSVHFSAQSVSAGSCCIHKTPQQLGRRARRGVYARQYLLVHPGSSYPQVLIRPHTIQALSFIPSIPSLCLYQGQVEPPRPATRCPTRLGATSGRIPPPKYTTPPQPAGRRVQPQ